MRTNLITSLVHALPAELSIGEASRATVAKIDAQPFPDWLKQLFWWDWPRKSGDIWPCYRMYAAKAMFESPFFNRLVASSMVPIGETINGDPLVIRFAEESAEVGFVSHEGEALYSGKGLARTFRQVTPTLEEFLLRVVDRLFLPTDSWDAGEFSSLLFDMRSGKKRRR